MRTARSAHSIPGGIHPAYSKEATQALPIERMPPPPRVLVSLAQHLGAPSKPLVNKGDAVAMGQPIAEPAGFISSWVHAPVSGTVKSVAEGRTPSGRTATLIEIENDGQDRPAGAPAPASRPDLGPRELADLVSRAGVIGMGGAGFPTHVKLSPPPGKTIDTLILNGAECEPFLTADHRLMLEHADKIWSGARLIARILGVSRIRVAVEDNKPDALAAMEKAMAGADGDAELVSLPTLYPHGAEKQLIYSILGREVPSGGLPMDVGALVENVGTAAAVHDAIVDGRPLIERIVTVTGPCVARPCNVLARVGTLLSDLIAFCGGPTGEPGKLICGGPMMGVAQAGPDVPMTKTTSGLLVLPRSAVHFFESTPCISCGRCVNACPMTLVPSAISQVVEIEDYEKADEYAVLDCIECGCCAYVCPAHRPMVHLMRQGKGRVALMRRQKAEQQKKG